MNRNILISVLCLFLSACVSTYELPSGVKTSQLTVRSYQGQGVTASIFESTESCSEIKSLKSNRAGRASKTYTIPSSDVLLSITMLPGTINSYSCKFTLKLNAEEGQHYVVDLISDAGKQRCNNRVFVHDNKDIELNAQYIDAAASALWTSKTSFCEKYQFNDITSPKGEFITTAYRNSAYSTGTPGVIGTTNNAVREK